MHHTKINAMGGPLVGFHRDVYILTDYNSYITE